MNILLECDFVEKKVTQSGAILSTARNKHRALTIYCGEETSVDRWKVKRRKNQPVGNSENVFLLGEATGEGHGPTRSFSGRSAGGNKHKRGMEENKSFYCLFFCEQEIKLVGSSWDSMMMIETCLKVAVNLTSASLEFRCNNISCRSPRV